MTILGFLSLAVLILLNMVVLSAGFAIIARAASMYFENNGRRIVSMVALSVGMSIVVVGYAIPLSVNPACNFHNAAEAIECFLERAE